MSVLGDLVVTLSANTAPLKAGLGQVQGMLSGFSGMMSNLLGGGFLEAAQESFQAQQKLTAVLASTGGAAGFTAEQIQQLASDMAMLTNFEDDVTTNAAAVLATFTQIRGDVFQSALLSAQDLSSVLGTDLQSSVILIGKALNDPIKGLTALGRAGVSFTAEQKETIKALVQSGDLMGAQKMILAELKTEFGGAAQAMADPMKMLQNTLGEVREEIGKALYPWVRALANLLIPFLQTWGKELALVATGVLGLIGVMKAITAVQKTIAIGQALIMSLSGPAGWAALAAGAAIFAGSLIAVNAAMDEATAEQERAAPAAAQFSGKLTEVSEAAATVGPDLKVAAKEVDEIKRAMHDALSPSTRLQIELREIRALLGKHMDPAAARSTFAGISASMIEKATGLKAKIQDITNEIRVMTGEASEADIAMEEMIGKGAKGKDVSRLGALMDQKEELKKQQDIFKDMQGEAKRVFEDTRTPLEQFETRMAELQQLFQGGFIDQETFNRAASQLGEDTLGEFNKGAKGTAAELRGPEAQQFGSREALSSVFASMRRDSDKVESEQLKVQQEMAGYLEEIARQRGANVDIEVVEIG